MTHPSADPLVGTTVAHYEILAKIGGGGMGVVYSAKDTKLGRTVALKFLPPQWSHDESAKQRFIREAQAASATDHPNICTIHDIAESSDGRLFLVMAHYEGQTLKQKIESGPLDVETAIEVAAQISEGLAKAHAQGIVHRDIKPGNLMVCNEAVKILDFGLAKFANSLQLTLEGSTLGTAAYMSPEQVRGEEADARSDVWSVGVVLYEMLAGHVPFSGTYAEAVAYAIKNETPVPLRTIRPGIPEAVEQVVFRALHKEPAVRHQSARDLARALRMLQGRTIAQDLLTMPLSDVPRLPPPARPRRRRLAWLAAAAVAAVALIAAAAVAWRLAPVERIPIAIVPVVNQTGFSEVEPYRLALTHTLVSELAESPNVRVVPYTRLLQMIRRFLADGTDVSSREAVRAIAMHSGARVLVVPTLVYENGTWRGRAEFQDASTATTTATWETPPVASSLAKETGYELAVALAAGIQDYFRDNGPGASYSARPRSARLRTLDAARAFEAGVNAYDELEYATARASFARAAEQDARNPLAPAWLSRASLLLRDVNGAADAAARAARLVGEDTAPADALFIAAVLADARGEAAAAEEHYRELTRAFPDEPAYVMDLAAFHDRQGGTEAAIALLQQVLAADSGLARADVDLCRLYNRLTDPARAREHAQRALATYRALGAAGGEGQALLCLTDVLRVGGASQQQEAQQAAAAAVAIFERPAYPYNRSRGYNYAALAAEARGSLVEAAAWWEKALAAAREGGNVVLEPLVLMNLGATQEKLGQRPAAVRYLRESYALFESLGDQARAAENQYNLGTILIDYGGDLDEGRRNVESAVAVFRKLGNRNFEIAAAQTTARYYRYTGRHAEAGRELNRAIALAKERNLDYEVATSMIRQAESRFDSGDYVEGRDLIVSALPRATGREHTEGRLQLGRTRARLGDFAGAAADLEQARKDVEASGDTGLLPRLYASLGELAYESGRFDEARAWFGRAAALWQDDMPDQASVEARAYSGLLDASRPRGRAAIAASLARAESLGHVSLEARCRLFLARLDLQDRRGADALRGLDAVPADDAERSIGRELRAFVLYWRGEALRSAGDAAAAAAPQAAARALVDEIQRGIEGPFREPFAARPDIQLLLTGRDVRLSPVRR